MGRKALALSLDFLSADRPNLRLKPKQVSCEKAALLGMLVRSAFAISYCDLRKTTFIFCLRKLNNCHHFHPYLLNHLSLIRKTPDTRESLLLESLVFDWDSA